MRQHSLSVPDAAEECAKILRPFSHANRAKVILTLLLLVLEDRPAIVLDVLHSANLMIADQQTPTNGKRWFHWFSRASV